MRKSNYIFGIFAVLGVLMMITVSIANASGTNDNSTPLVDDSTNLSSSIANVVTNVDNDTGVKFQNDVNPDNFDITANDTTSSIEISLTNESSEPSSQTIGVPIEYTCGGYCDVVHIDNSGNSTISRHKAKIVGDTAYIDVNFTSVIVYPAIGMVVNQDFESTDGYGMPTSWDSYNTGSVTSWAQVATTTSAAHGSYSLLQYVTSGSGVIGEKQAIRLKGYGTTVSGFQFVTIDCWIKVTNYQAGSVTVDVQGSDGTVASGSTVNYNTDSNDWVHYRTTTQATFAAGTTPYVRVYVTSPSSGGTGTSRFYVDEVVVTMGPSAAPPDPAGVSSTETADINHIQSNFNFTTTSIDNGQPFVMAYHLYRYNLYGHYNTTISATLDGTATTCYYIGDWIYVASSGVNAGTHTVAVTATINPPGLAFPLPGDSTVQPISLMWVDVAEKNFPTPSYQYEVYTNADGSGVVASGTTSNNWAVFNLAPGNYYWHVRAWDAGFNAWGDWSAISSPFTSTRFPYFAGQGVVGELYDSAAGENSPVQGTATIENNTWSTVITSDSDGIFHTALANGTYTIYATSNGYDTSNVYPFTVNGSYVQTSIPLKQTQSYFYPHYVDFCVCAPWGTKYEGVTATVYDVAKSTTQAMTSAKTQNDGSVTFALDPSKTYRITFIDPTQNINTERTLVPSGNQYDIWVYLAVQNTSAIQGGAPPVVPTVNDLIRFGVTSSNINSSYAYLNQSIANTDSTSHVISWTTTITQVYDNGTSTNGYSYSTSGTGIQNVSVIVARGYSYNITTPITHPLLTSTDIETKAINVAKTLNIDFGWADAWNYQFVGLILMLVMGGLFGQFNAKTGAFCTMLVGWFNVWAGWFTFDTGQMLMAMFATLLVIGYMLTAQRSD